MRRRIAAWESPGTGSGGDGGNLASMAASILGPIGFPSPRSSEGASRFTLGVSCEGGSMLSM